MHLRFLHTADLQIGMTRWFLEPEAQARYTQDRIDAIARMGRIAVEHDCAFIVMAGDVLDDNAVKQQTLARTLEALRALPVPVYLHPGNHDPLAANSPLIGSDLGENITVFHDHAVIEASPGVELVGAPMTTRHPSHDLVAASLQPLDPTSKIRIAVGHGQAESFSNEIDPSLIDLELVEKRIREGAIDYLALGDTHSAQPVGSSQKVWFSGAPEATDFRRGQSGEVNSGKALVVDVEKHGLGEAKVHVEEVQVGRWRFEERQWQINSSSDAEQCLAELKAMPQKETTVVKYSLVGTVDLSTKELLESGIATLAPLFAALYEHQRLMDLVLEPSEDDLDALGFHGWVAAAIEEFLEAEDDTSKDALNLLFRLGTRG